MRLAPGIFLRACWSAPQSHLRVSSVLYSLAQTTADRPARKSGSGVGFWPEIHSWVSLQDPVQQDVHVFLNHVLLNMKQ